MEENIKGDEMSEINFERINKEFKTYHITIDTFEKIVAIVLLMMFIIE